MIARSSDVSPSRRAASSAPMVGGMSMFARSPVATQCPSTARSTPCSVSIVTSCSTNSGFPSAASVTRAVTASATPASPSIASTIREVWSLVSGRRVTNLEPRSSPSEGCSTRGSSRDVHSSITGPPPPSARNSIRSSKVDSAHWMSSMTSTDGRPRPRTRWLDGCPRRAPAAGTRRSTCRWRRRPAPRLRRSSRAAVSPARASSEESSSRMPVASRRISTRGQNVMPSPYGRHWPRATSASCSIVPRNSRVSLDFPTPASPMTSTTRTHRSSMVCANVEQRTASSSSRPTIVAWARPGLRSGRRRPSSRYAATGSSLPFSSSGSTGSASTASRTSR